jgi:serine protease inhibitor
MSTNTKFRWIQFSNSGGSSDSWGIDNIKVSTISTPTLTITNLTTGAIVGTSSTSPYTVSVSPTSTTNYQASITDGTTTCVFPLTITVTSATTPTFAPVANVCQNASPPVLPTTSTNSITGTWSPAVSTAAVGTATYTFTPTAGQCASTATLTVTTIAPTLPTFNTVPAICSGGSLASLPTTSNNTIIGTWSPALNNTATTIYTFTPATAQCANTTTLTITVNTVSTTPTFTAIPAICAGATISALPTTSNNTINGTWSPSINNTATTVYTFTPTTGQCANTTTLTITVNPVSILSITNNNPACQPNSLSWGTWNSISNNNAIGTVGNGINVSVNHSSGGLSSSSQMYAVSNFPAQYNVPLNATAIRNDLAGTFTFCFNQPVMNPQVALSSIGNSSTPVQINTSVPYIVTWSGIAMTYPNNQTFIGQEGFTIVTFPGLHTCISFDYLQSETYCNLAFGVQDVNCQISPICSGQSVSLLAHGADNFLWSPSVGLDVTTGNNVVASPTTTTNYSVSDINGCSSPAQITVTVNPVLTPNFAQIGPYCSGDLIPALATTSINGITGTWSPAVSTAAVGTATYTFTPTAGQCASTTTLTVTTIAPTVPTFNAVSAVCLNSTAPVLPATSLNSFSGTWSPAVSTASVGTATYTFTPTAAQCASTTTLTVTTIAPTVPTFNAVSAVCLNSTAPVLPTNSTNTTPILGAWSPAVSTAVAGTAVYTYTPTAGQCATTASLSIVTTTTILPTFAAIPNVCQNATSPVLPLSSTNVPAINGTWAPAVSTSVLGVGTYTFTPAAGQCAINTTLNITVTAPVLPTFTPIANICQNATAPVLTTTSTNAITGTWSPAVSTATVGTTTYTFTPSAGQCASTATLTVTTNAPTIPTFNAVSDVCLNSSAPVLPANSTNAAPIPGVWAPAVSTAVAGTAVYTFTPASGQCATNASLSIVTTTTILPAFAAIPNVCQNATAPILPVGSTNTPAITGAWAPAVSTASLGTSSYTFTPNPGQCASNTTLNITVSTPVLPTFTPIANVCQNGTAPVLLTTSLEAVTGTWSPAVSTATTGPTTYTFTPTAGMCATNTTLTITIDTPVIPTFSPVANVCQNATAPILPNSSSNSTPINGLWSPTVSTSVSGAAIYTFTPTAGQCANTTTLTITVDPAVNPTFTAVPAICSGEIITALPTSSNNAINGAWSPALNNTTTTLYTFTPTAGQCANTTTLTISVNSVIIPTFTAVPAICSGATIAALPTTSNNSINGAWSPSIDNTATTIYTFTPATGQCANTTTLTITVNPNITPDFTAVPAICSGATIAALPTTSTNAINGAWSPSVNNTATTVYTFTPATGQCSNTTTLTITVDPTVNPTFTAVPAICSGEIIAALPTTSNNAINGAWSPALNNLTTTLYTFTPTAGQCANTTTLTITVNSGIIPTFTAVTPICTGETIATLPVTSNNAINGTWSPAINNTTTTIYTFTPAIGQCANTTTLTVTVNPNITPSFTAVPAICSGATIAALPTTSTNAINGSWSPSIDNTATTMYTFTPELGECASKTTLIITINTVPTLLITDPLGVCSPLSINLTDNSITAGSTPVSTLSYWTNIQATNPLINPSNISTSGTYYILSTFQGCSVIKPVNTMIYPIPTASFITSYTNYISAQQPTMIFNNTSIGGAIYNWDFGDGQSSTLENPENTYVTNDQPSYLITLQVISDYGCINSTSKLIEVKEELIYYIPNSFTPDGGAYNQVFLPILTSGYDPETYHLSIFNRWGELTFESFDVLEGWDGVNTRTNMKDIDGTYTWKIEFKLKGRLIKEKLYGHVNLLK